MAILEQLQAVVDFIVDGKIAASQPTFQPSESRRDGRSKQRPASRPDRQAH